MSEKEAWVNLSDGGHIENMAIYELLRRRCKFIISVDGEADPQSTFHGHLTLVRHAQIDFGIRIEPDLSAATAGPDVEVQPVPHHDVPGALSGQAAGFDPLPEAFGHRKRDRDDQALPRADPRLSAPEARSISSSTRSSSRPIASSACMSRRACFPRRWSAPAIARRQLRDLFRRLAKNSAPARAVSFRVPVTL